MDGLAEVVGAVDSPWAVVALVLVLSYALLWKFGKDILESISDTRERTQDIQKSIITNHGSASLGDAVDRLTDKVMRIEDTQASDRAVLRSLARDQERHLEECRDFHNPGKFIETEGSTRASAQ